MTAPATRRDELLALIVDELLAYGVAELSLRPLAEQVGTSARLLIYHFETREKLLAAALAQVRARVERALTDLAARERPKTLKAVLLMFWDWALQPANQSYFRLLFEVDGLSMYGRPADAPRNDGTAVWLAMINRSASGVTDPAPEFATLIMAAMNGLLQDFLSTGDRARTTAALMTLIERLVSEPARKGAKS
jgi:AcrR family transcriptional regulator